IISLADKLEIIREKIIEYAKPALTGEIAYFTQSTDGKVFSVIDVSSKKDNSHAYVSIAARLVGNYVVIEHDANNKPLVDALVQGGIPRSQIILAYAGESVPESA